jgi:hypothetical protein
MFIGLAVWGMAVLGGTIGMIAYSNSPGPSGDPPGRWPAGSQIPFDTDKFTLLMFVHPHCPCSRASLGELEVLLSQCPRQLSTHVVFVKPKGTITNWEKTDLWRDAMSIPGVKASSDIAGVEASRFHAETSGQVLLYDRNGTLRFQGGITLGRGHAGDNPGRSDIEEIVRNGRPDGGKTPVYGCSLFDDQGKEGEAICKP